jgi:4-alpha-glucanotransferase
MIKNTDGCISHRVKSVNGHFRKNILDLSQRDSGVLLHVSSLPGKFGIGDLGPVAHQWVRMLLAARQRWWQMLPLGPCGEDNSPYRAYSAFAGNPLLISPEQLVEDGLLNAGSLAAHMLPSGNVNFARVRRNKLAMLSQAHAKFLKRRSAAFDQFIAGNHGWLDDFCLFMALREARLDLSWTQWPRPLLRRNARELSEARRTFASAIGFHQFVQFVFFRQLQTLRAHAREAGVALIGDLPIFVSPDSVDVWTHPELFQLDRQFRPRAIAGVPPDQFSATGQRWGNPLYNWQLMKKDGFAWWKARVQSALQQADLVRIDHFRGFQAYWRIPADAPTAKVGRWIKAPGMEFFEALLKKGSHLPLLAEDLGIITPAVEALRDKFGLPGMRVLQFGFTAEVGNPHSPHNFIPHCFAFTGTHDNDTAAGWYKSLSPAFKKRLAEYAPNPLWKTEPAWPLIHILMGSTARHAIVPLQDLLCLGSDCRMNHPGRGDHNWNWRVGDLSLCKQPLQRLADLGRLYDRDSTTQADPTRTPR